MSYFKHGLSRTPEYNSWSNMIKRCQDPRNEKYARYGGRGISVCSSWLRFETFYADMGTKPGLDYTIDRINPNGNYEPSNCRWLARKEQQRNLAMRAANKSGYTGVFFDRTRGKWRVQISDDGRLRYVGSFVDILEAANAYRMAKLELGYSPLHGEPP